MVMRFPGLVRVGGKVDCGRLAGVTRTRKRSRQQTRHLRRHCSPSSIGSATAGKGNNGTENAMRLIASSGAEIKRIHIAATNTIAESQRP